MNKKFLLIAFVVILIGSMMSLHAKDGNDAPKKAGNASLPSGYGELSWGSYFNDARDKVKGTVVYSGENNRIVSKEGEIRYTYGYFFPDPEVISGKGEGKPESDAAAKESPAKLYYVVVQFPYVAMEDVKKKVVEKYGEPQGESMRKNQGAYIWESEQTTVIMWVDSYNNSPYCRKLTYMSKVIARDINEYRKVLFNSKERDILRQLTP